ncbi:hypothetical protein A2424_02730 [Candidatus Peribacteria bacterium RIFOXYC1_FULL_54_13]|nr:MAG: hypothetical protein A2198_04055 [Candidatus Peribacteria bacterium RIFOXYA1_FULL_56_14]OGJ74035.1 MAG: hypothetical protein A2217_00090 [Candidatus Peribacteria bacterium RIFOXYA2_FULL_55_28]OGJ75466.1 MAG: hypothetical protein A2384_01050 [Candidatus Peribacteria bacterium RIFOXYB1_FULL_54_35]OGJ76358.1 MAG: hypothetical protein A2327_00820 [Candidatus Peribacteria bacterium RIFOXYB2_FULL_54_17]OGJ79412.1 MAG: hypothetical protein A2424_02730 [Candidatus Peribacteria bacterium RIFOXYC
MLNLNRRLFARHLEDDEILHLVVHKHWLLGLKFLFWPSASFLACWVLLYQAPFKTVFYAISVWSVISLIWWLRNFFDYYLDAWIITDMGIIDVAWHGWFHRQSSRVLYSDIQGVSYEIQGITNTLLRYGTISVEKISTGSVISLDNVSKPRRIEGIILKNMEAYLHSKNLKDAKHVQDILSTLIAREVQLGGFEEEEDSSGRG